MMSGGQIVFFNICLSFSLWQTRQMMETARTYGARCQDFFSPYEGSSPPRAWSKRILLGIWRRRRCTLLLLDAVIMFSVFLIAYLVRFQTGFQDYFATKEHLDFEAYFMSTYVRAAIIFTAIWVFLMARDGVYSYRLISAGFPRAEIQNILKSGLESLAILMAISFLFRGFLLSRFVYGMAFVFGAILIIGSRKVGRVLSQKVFQLGVPKRQTLVIGTNPLAIEFASTLEKGSNGFQEIIGFLEFPDEECSNIHGPDCKILGVADDIDRIRGEMEFDRVIVSAGDFLGAMEKSRAPLLMRILNYCEAYKIPLYLISFSTDVMVLRSEMGSYRGIPLLLLKDSVQHPLFSAVKRVLDLFLSVLILTLGLPFWVIIALAIKATSPGPVLYVQERVGRNGKPFKMLKFRSMVQDADKQLQKIVDFSSLAEPVFKIRDDPRVTRIGSFLRKSSLDEIPQLLNVLKGEMSLVGPRPEQIDLVKMYNEHQWRRLKAKPGITGYQQVMSRGDLCLAKRVEYDLYYLKHQSILLDLIILFRTIIVVIRGDGIL
jgi:exopolysaccharide biosynthesis polyprenyl glycosylphosphotransferase